MQVHLNSNTLDIKTLDTKPDTTKGNRICLGKGMKREVKRNSKKKRKKKGKEKKRMKHYLKYPVFQKSCVSYVKKELVVNG